MSVAAPPSTPPVSGAPGAGSRAAPSVPRGTPIRDSGPVRRDSVRATSWTVAGLAKVDGDVDVDAATVRGLLSVGGKLAAGRLSLRGTFDSVGPVDVRETLTIDGTARLGASVHSGDLRTRGTFHAVGPVRVDRGLFAEGSVEAPSVAATLVELTGSAEIPGALVATGVVRVRFRADSKLGEVRAPRVELAGPPTSLVPTLLRRVFGGSASAHVVRVEAEAVELSAVDVGFVRAERIVLGPGAHVTTVEGTIVRRHPTSRVGPESRSPPPHGLSR